MAGGLRTYYGHNALSDYDKITNASEGVEKKRLPDEKLDLLNFVLRNPTGAYGGTGIGKTNNNLSLKIKIGNQLYDCTNYTYQGEGIGNLALSGTIVLRHELALSFWNRNSAQFR